MMTDKLFEAYGFLQDAEYGYWNRKSLPFSVRVSQGMFILRVNEEYTIANDIPATESNLLLLLKAFHCTPYHE